MRTVAPGAHTTPGLPPGGGGPQLSNWGRSGGVLLATCGCGDGAGWPLFCCCMFSRLLSRFASAVLVFSFTTELPLAALFGDGELELDELI